MAHNAYPPWYDHTQTNPKESCLQPPAYKANSELAKRRRAARRQEGRIRSSPGPPRHRGCPARHQATPTAIGANRDSPMPKEQEGVETEPSRTYLTPTGPTEWSTRRSVPATIPREPVAARAGYLRSDKPIRPTRSRANRRAWRGKCRRATNPVPSIRPGLQKCG